MKRWLFLLGLLLGLGASGDAFAGSPYDPRLDWRTLSTEHFDIHFATTLTVAAARLAPIAEEAHRLLAAEMQWEPFYKTQIVLTDTYDDANGMTSTDYYGRIVLYVVPPAADGSLADYDDWLRLLIVHEYTHLMNRDQHRLPFSLLRWTLGNFGFSSPNLFQPRWMAEAYAVRNETRFTTGGRLRSSYVDMFLREDILSDNFHPLGQGHDGLVEWPGGNFDYFYGSWFSDYYEKTNGRDSWQEYNNCWSTGACCPLVPCNGLSLLSYYQTRRFLGDHYQDWRAALRQRYQLQLNQLGAQPLTNFRSLTATGYYTDHPRFSPTGLLAFARRTPHEHGAIVARAPGEERAAFQFNTTSGSALAFFPDGRLLYAQQEIVDQYYVYSDLWVYDPTTAQSTQLTHGARLTDPDVAADGRSIIATRLGPLTRQLVLLDGAGNLVRELTPAEPNLTCETARFSPDGQQAAAVCFEQGGRHDIYLIDLASGARRRLTADRYLDLSPTWTPDGQAVIFSSDRTGVFNLWIYRLADGSLARLTNVRGGAFEPSVDPTGRLLAFSSYSSGGFDIATLDFNPQRTLPTDELAPDRAPRVYDYPEVASSVTPYSPWKSVAPHYWMPLLNGAPFYYFLLAGNFSVSAVGASTAGFDALEQHAFSLTAWREGQFGKFNYAVAYANGQFEPTITVTASEQVAAAGVYADLAEPREVDRYKTVFERQFQAALSVSYNWPRLESNYHFGYGWNFTRVLPMTILPPYAEPRETGLFSGPTANFSFTNAQRYGYSISPTDGRSFSLSWEEPNRLFGGDYNQPLFLGRYYEFIGLPFRHVLMLGLTGGISYGDRLKRGAFSLGGVDPLLAGLHGVELRGYRPGRFEGNTLAVFTAEYRLPLWAPEWGVGGTWPYFVKDFLLRLFNDYGYAWDRKRGEPLVEFSDWRGGAGAELAADFTVFYYLSFGMKIGYARGYSPNGEGVFYIVADRSFP